MSAWLACATGVLRIFQKEGTTLYRDWGWTVARNAPGSFAVRFCVSHPPNADEICGQLFGASEVLAEYQPFFEYVSDDQDASVPWSFRLNWCSLKVQTLVDILLESYTPEFHGIVFVECRHITRVLSSIISRVPSLKGLIACAECVLSVSDYSKATWTQSFIATVAGAIMSITVAAPLDTIKMHIQNANFEQKMRCHTSLLLSLLVLWFLLRTTLQDQLHPTYHFDWLGPVWRSTSLSLNAVS